MFVQWTTSGGSLTGSAQEVTTQGQVPNLTTANQTLAVTGTLSGSTLSVSLNGAPDTFGTLSGAGLTLNFPQANGTLAPISFQSATATQFDAAVSTLGQQVYAADQQAASAQALQQAQTNVNNQAGAVSADIATLSQDESALSGDVQAIPADLQTEATDLATTHSDEQKVAAEAKQYPSGNNGQVCNDASGVETDASGVETDASGVETDASGVETDLSTLRADVQALNLDFAKFQSEEANLPGYQPANTPTQQGVIQAVDAANGAISTALNTTNGYIDQANADANAANGYAANANQAGNCGSPPTAPSPQSHIS